MPKKLSIIVLLLIQISFTTNAQDFQYYKNIEDATASNLLVLESIDSVLSISHKKDPATFIEYSILYIDLAKKLDSFSLAAEKAILLQRPLSRINNDPGKAITILSSVLANKYKIKDSTLIGKLFLKRADANSRVDLKSAIEDYTTALNQFTKKDSVFVADVYLFRGQAHSNLGKFVSASDDYKMAYTYYENLKDYMYMCFAQQGNITMFSKNGFYEKAKKERTDLVNKLIELDLGEFLSTEYYNQALDYKRVGNDKLELEYLLLAKKNHNDSLNGNMFIYIHSKLAEYYSRNRMLKKAIREIELIEPRYAKVTEDRYAELNYSGAKATYLMALGDYEKSLSYAKKKLESATILGYEEEILDAYAMLSGVYKEMGSFEKSLENRNNYSTLQDSIYNRANANSLAYYQTKFEIQEKENELAEKNTNILLLEKDSETFKNLMFFVSLALMLIFGIILLYRNRQNLNSKKTLMEGLSQKLLVSQEQERMRISKDLHDGVGQQLLLLKNKLIAVGEESAKTMVDNTIEEVRNISRDLHPFVLQELGITKAIEHTLTQIDENTTVFISSEIDNIDNIFTPEEEVNIYRIIQESLSNTIKHARAKATKVLVKKFTNSIIISIKDNGIGFDFSEKYKDNKSLGLKTLLERTKFVNGQMKVVSRKENGTLIEFKFPVQ